jgi:hypothetical protein
VADIFLSYAREDRDRIKILVDWLEKQGWAIWWDRRIPPGKTYDQVIEGALNAARCIIVVWSKDSVASEWVRNEAEEGSSRKILVPILIDDVRAPLGFRRMQAANLVDWSGDPQNPELESLFQAVADTLSTQDGTPKSDQIRPERTILPAFSEPVSSEPIAVTLRRDRLAPRWYQRRRVLIGVIGLGVLMVFLTLIFLPGLFSSTGPSPNDHVANVNTNSSPGPSPPAATPTPGIEVIFDKQIEIFNNRNIYEVENNPPNPTQFTIDSPYYLTLVSNYHWNDEHGKDPTGMHLKLRNSQGQDFAQCEFSATSSAAGKTPNVNWNCSPNVILPAGTYTVIDPDPKTWSHNKKSGNAGFSLITGYATRTR